MTPTIPLNFMAMLINSSKASKGGIFEELSGNTSHSSFDQGQVLYAPLVLANAVASLFSIASNVAVTKVYRSPGVVFLFFSCDVLLSALLLRHA